jgi:hypothetical protein
MGLTSPTIDQKEVVTMVWLSNCVFPSPDGGMRTAISDTWLRIKEQAASLQVSVFMA